MEIIAIKNWDEVSIKLNNHETLMLLQALKSDSDDIREAVADLKGKEIGRDLRGLVEMSVNIANDKVKLHNELLPCFRSDYEHLMLEPIELS